MTCKMFKWYSLPWNVVKIFFPFQQEIIFLHFFQLFTFPRTANVSADRSTKICSVHFLTDHPVWRTSVLVTTILREIKHVWPVPQQPPASPMISFTTTGGTSALLLLQERKRCKRFGPTTLLCNIGCFRKSQSRIQNLRNWNISIQDNRLVWRLVLNLGVLLWNI